MSAKTHLTLQGKGGVGKSFSASTIAQWLSCNGRDPTCIDTDPFNRTFAAYSALKVHTIDILEGDDINPRRFDDIVELVSAAPSDVVIDSGATSFVALSHYLLSNDIPALLEGLEHPLVLHVAITGGQAMQDTLHGLTQIAAQFPQSAELVVWLSPFWGPIVHDGKEFEEMRAYTQHAQRIRAIVRVPRLKPETFGADLEAILRARLTFAEALAVDAGRGIMVRQRLKTIRDQLFAQLSAAAL